MLTPLRSTLAAHLPAILMFRVHASKTDMALLAEGEKHPLGSYKHDPPDEGQKSKLPSGCIPLKATSPTYNHTRAHYTEQMMIDEGFGGGDPKIRMGQLADALLRLCRFEVGIREHTRGMTVDQATRFFMDNGYMGETPSRIEAERGTFDPTHLVYTVGKLAILKLRDDYKRDRREQFTLQEFHDRLLSNGNAPIWVHRQVFLQRDKGNLIE